MLASPVAHAASRLSRETIAAGGGMVGSGNPMNAVVVIGEPAGGGMSGSAVRVQAGAHAGTFTLRPGTKAITVEGTLADPTATVTVNSQPTTVSGATFRKTGLTIVEGTNTIRVVATDPAGNQSIQTITVLLDTWPPPRPTINTTPPVTASASATLSGTKEAGTSVWIDGRQVVAANSATTWTATVSLVEGDNVFSVMTKDAVGNTSTAATITIVLDNLPPVITISAPAKTNLTPVALTGTVDDSLTRVVVNGRTATRTGKRFDVDVPLVEGPNTVTIIATSPNGFVSTKTLTITLGTIPTITAIQPADAAKPYVGAPMTITLSATDKEGDPIQYQILLDSQVLVGWGTTSSAAWTPTVVQRGLHTVEVQARDAFGGQATKNTQVYVVRKPVTPQ